MVREKPSDALPTGLSFHAIEDKRTSKTSPLCKENASVAPPSRVLFSFRQIQPELSSIPFVFYLFRVGWQVELHEISVRLQRDWGNLFPSQPEHALKIHPNSSKEKTSIGCLEDCVETSVEWPQAPTGISDATVKMLSVELESEAACLQEGFIAKSSSLP